MIVVENVAYSYPNQPHPAVQEVSLEVGPGERIGIVGPNGSGKSTLGRLMKGILLPTKGRLAVDSLDTGNATLEVRRRVGLVFQNPNSQIVNSVVEQEVAFGPENIGLPAAEIRGRVDEALDAVGLAGRESAECHNLSMADKQRVALASVVVMDPSYLILDEPTAWLEPSARWPLLDTVVRWCEDRRAALILVTHRMDEAQLCERLYGMLDGRVEVTGTPETVFQDENIRTRLALEIPETMVLANELHAAGLPVNAGAGIDRLADALCHS